MSLAVKKTLVGAGIIVLALQFFSLPRNISAAAPGAQDITVLYPTPDDVKTILAESCYDCHSDNTRYPWYTYVQPVGWWLQHHVNEGKRHLNFSQFGVYPPQRARRKLEAVTKKTKAGDMPLASYLVLHRHARLTEAQVQSLGVWAAGIRARIPAPAAP